MDSILTDTKLSLGITEENEHFDTQIVMCINTVLNVLTQMGVGPAEGYSISDKSSKWDDFLGKDPRKNLVKTYVYLRVKLLFDPGNSSVTDAMIRQIDEIAWRIYSYTNYEEET